MTERVTAWQCIGCGRIEAPQPCIGVCQDRKVEVVNASDYDEVLSQLALTRSQVEALAALVRQLAHTTPREGEWERTYRAFQDRARRLDLAQVFTASSLLESREINGSRACTSATNCS